MKRRHVLSLLGSAAFGGCVSAPQTGTEDAVTTRKLEQMTTTGTDLSELGVPNPNDCPSFSNAIFSDNVSRVVCATSMDDPLTIVPATQSGSLPESDFTFTLVNGTTTTYKTNYYSWSVWKREDGQWFRVAPTGWPIPQMSLSPGSTHRWNLTVNNTDLDRSIPRAEGTESATVVGLGAGTYAFGIDGWFEGQSYENQTGVVARFELQGDSLELQSFGIENVERDGETVILHDPPEREKYRANYVVTHVETPEKEPRRQITEQVIRDTPLRNALAHFQGGVRQVRLQTEAGTYPPFGIDEPRFVRYEGTTFRIETEWAGEPPE